MKEAVYKTYPMSTQAKIIEKVLDVTDTYSLESLGMVSSSTSQTPLLNPVHTLNDIGVGLKTLAEADVSSLTNFSPRPEAQDPEVKALTAMLNTYRNTYKTLEIMVHHLQEFQPLNVGVIQSAGTRTVSPSHDMNVLLTPTGGW